MSDNSSVQVALRVRPLVPHELKRGCKSALEVVSSVKQVQIADKAFTFNHVFSSESSQEEFYQQSVEKLIPNLFKGFNVTILAYGQTGSGKTHSMGTTYNGEGEMGVIPRAVHDIFKYINDNFTVDFNVTVSFMELYQEVLFDLLSTKPRDQCVMEIREDVNKGVFIPGLTEIRTQSAKEVLDCLQQGSKGRATSSTNMNSQSSRSHAIFTINISMTPKGGSECRTAKFHLVDLAGSERPKKTGAVGQTFKEGVNINKGLFVLGNVISALGDEKGAPAYVNYRESNLTRLLKDSLGGNSITMMVACVSPADYNAEETISTLRYADRARRIKNKPVVNEDPKAAEISKLIKENQQLKLLMSAHGGGPVVSTEEMNALKVEISTLKNRLNSTIYHNIALNERILLMQASSEGTAAKFQALQGEYSTTLQNLNKSVVDNDLSAVKNQLNALSKIETHFNDIDNETKRSEAEIQHIDRSNLKDDDPKFINEDEIGEQQESHMNMQMELDSRIKHVTKELAAKEDLVKQIAANAKYMVNMDELTDNQNKITELESEKAELIRQLKQAQSQGAGGKISEQRRKRVQELESQLHDLNRKVNEQARLIKLKEKDDIKLKRLNNEITSMKSEKIKLVKSMRAESERFRKWKLERERELSKLQNQDRKRLNQIATMKNKHTMQENVWKRKLEEAAASSKRLKDALALRKNVQDTKYKGKVERLGPWVHQEMTIHANRVAVQVTKDILMADRTALQEQVDKLKENEADNEDEIKRLEEQIEMRSAQFADLNQKLIDSSDDCDRKRFDNVQTMAEAKYVLNELFDMVGDFKKNEIEKGHKLAELEGDFNEMKATVKALKAQLVENEKKHTIALSIMQKEYEEKTLLLLQQLRGVQVAGIDEQTKHRIDMQEEMIFKLQAELEEQKNKVSIVVEPSTPPKKKKKSESSKEKENKPIQLSALDEYNTSIEEDDSDKDPDWRKTPLGKQVSKVRLTSLHVQTLKRSCSGGCGCRGACASRHCACKKIGKGCNSMCKCKLEICANRSEHPESDLVPTQEADDESDTSDQENDDVSFKKPRLTGNLLIRHTKKNIAFD